MDSSESNTNQSVMTFGNKSSESGEHSSDRPYALPANVDTSMTSESDPSDQQEFGSSVTVSTRGRPRNVSLRKRDLRSSHPKGRNRTPRSVTRSPRQPPQSADDQLDEQIRIAKASAKPRQKPPVVSSPRAAVGKPPTVHKSVGKSKSPTGTAPQVGKSYSPIRRQGVKMIVDQPDIPLVGAGYIVPISGACPADVGGQQVTASLGSTTSSGYVIVGAQSPNVVISPQTMSGSAAQSPGVSAITSGVSATSNAGDSSGQNSAHRAVADVTISHLKKAVSERDEQLTQAAELVVRERAETARRLELSQKQVKHFVDQVELQDRHIYEQQRVFGEAEKEYHLVCAELNKTREVAIRLNSENAAFKAQIESAAQETSRVVQETISKCENIVNTARAERDAVEKRISEMQGGSTSRGRTTKPLAQSCERLRTSSVRATVTC